MQKNIVRSMKELEVETSKRIVSIFNDIAKDSEYLSIHEEEINWEQFYRLLFHTKDDYISSSAESSIVRPRSFLK